MVPGTTVPKPIHARALCSPFDPLLWNRFPTQRIFGFDYQIEIYVPEAKRNTATTACRSSWVTRSPGRSTSSPTARRRRCWCAARSGGTEDQQGVRRVRARGRVEAHGELASSGEHQRDAEGRPRRAAQEGFGVGRAQAGASSGPTTSIGRDARCVNLLRRVSWASTARQAAAHLRGPRTRLPDPRNGARHRV